jgi:hypothetical protein
MKEKKSKGSVKKENRRCKLCGELSFWPIHNRCLAKMLKKLTKAKTNGHSK